MPIKNSFNHIRMMNLRFISLCLSLLISIPVLHAQSDVRISLDIKNTALEEVLGKIQKQNALSFVIKPEGLDLEKKVDAQFRETPLRTALQQLFSGQSVDIEIKDKIIRISAVDSTYIVKGTVTDNAGEPIPGATIFVKGTTTGTVSDLDGRYELQLEKPELLQCTCMGYKDVQKKVDGEMTLKFVMELNTEFLDEVVVVGYGEMRRSLVSSAISKVAMDENKLRNVTNPTELLNGRVAGVMSSVGSGNLGSGERMQIRGASSITAGNEPLYVIDGIPITNDKANLFNLGEDMSSLSVLNLSDIESIEVLKDAASAAIYGSKATNGVIVITTKSGKNGSSNARINISTGVSEFPNKNKIKMADSKLWLEVYNEGVDNYNRQYHLKVGDKGFKNHKQNPFGNLPDINWLDEVTQLGSFFNADLAFSGGNKKTNYYIGANYNYKEGVIRHNKLHKANFKAKINHDFNDWIRVGANVSANYMKNWMVPGPNTGSTILGRTIMQRPYDRPFKPDGDYYIGGTDELKYHNPIQILNEENIFMENLRYLGSYFIDLRWGNKLSFKNTLNTDITQYYNYTNYNENHPYGKGVGRVVDQNRTVKNLMLDTILSYNDAYLDNSIHFSLLAGHSFQIISNHNSNLDGMGFPSPSFDAVGVAAELTSFSGNFNNYTMESWFGRMNLSYKDRYTLTATLRGDGSSKFAKHCRWGLFPSVSFGWNISKEPFMEGKPTDLKFRISYGKTGNQEGIGTFAYQALMAGGQNYGENSGINTTAFGNQDLTWEKAHQFDVGFDMSFFNDKLAFIIDGYYKKTEDLLYAMPTYATSGTTNIISNIGSMQNIGAEVTMNINLDFGQVHWGSSFNISTNFNKILSLTDETKPFSIGNNRALQVGQSMGSFYLFKHDGVFQYDGEVPKPQYEEGRRAGDIRWKDVDGNGIINDNDRIFMGNSNPDFFGGWDNNFTWKGITLGLFFTYMYGNDVYSAEESTMARAGSIIGLQEKYATNRWTGPGSTNIFSRAMNGDTNNYRNSDLFLHDGSFFRLRTLTLSYTFPGKIAKAIAMKNLRIYAQIDNVFLATRYPGWDPEVSNNMDPRFFGVDKLSVPQPRTYTFGLNITF